MGKLKQPQEPPRKRSDRVSTGDVTADADREADNAVSYGAAWW
jgi:hypothetical protein